MYGPLDDLLPVRDDTPALEKFLYGPNPGRFGLGGLRNPQGMALFGNRILVCDQGFPDTLAIDLATGKSTTWGDADHRPRCPVDIATDAEGRAYVADTTLRSVLAYAADERFLGELRPNNGPEDSFRPCSVVVHDGVLYVGNLAGRRVDRFDVSREVWLPPWTPGERGLQPAPDSESQLSGAAATRAAVGGSPYATVGPSLVAPTGLSVGPDNVLLVADAVQGVVHRVTPDGRWLMPIGRPGREPGQFVRPKQVRCTASGLVFVSDAGRQSVLAFDATGQFLFEVNGDPGDGRGFSMPMGLVTMNSSDLPLLSKRLAEDPTLRSDECVIVSDTLGGQSLVVLGVVTHTASSQPSVSEGRSDAR